MNQLNFKQEIITLIDVSSFVFTHIHSTHTYIKLANIKVNDDSLKKILIRNFFAKLHKLRSKFENIVMCYDGKTTSTWRYKIFNKYKQKRSHEKKTKTLFKILYDVIIKLNFIHIKLKQIECDDIIACISMYFSNIIKYVNIKKPINIISNDSDFHQLLMYSHIKLYNNKFQEIKLTKQEALISLNNKIAKGDPCDNIPHSKNTSIEFNRTLIDFKCIPTYINDIIIKYFMCQLGIIKKRKILLYKSNWKKAIVVNRPSKKIKSPYLADVKMNGKDLIVHSPALGMSGMISKNSVVYITPISNPKKTTHRINLVKQHHVYVGAEPILCNKIVEIAIQNNWIPMISNKCKIIREYTIKNTICNECSRIDFYIQDGDVKHLVEVKNVILADNNYAYFPDGYKKSGEECVSMRALKHVKTLERFCKTKNNMSHLIYIIQRNDVEYFRLHLNRDPIYAKATWRAMFNGVKIHVYKIKWDLKQGCCCFQSVPFLWN